MLSQQLIVAKIASPTIFEIWALKVFWSRLDLSGSLDVISHMTVRFTIGHFLLVALWNQPSLYL